MNVVSNAGLTPAAAPPLYDWQLTLWDSKDRVVAREYGNSADALMSHALAMVAEGSAADWEFHSLAYDRELAALQRADAALARMIDLFYN